jgi:hypothetical protein
VGEADHAEDCQRLEETHCACEVGVKVREVREEGSVWEKGKQPLR